jgi:hypothetical protein
MYYNVREKFSKKELELISMMNDQFSYSLNSERNNGQYKLRFMRIHYITPPNSFTFPVFSSSWNVCNLTMKCLFLVQ